MRKLLLKWRQMFGGQALQEAEAIHEQFQRIVTETKLLAEALDTDDVALRYMALGLSSSLEDVAERIVVERALFATNK